MTPEQRKAARDLAIYELWRRGDLYYKLHATQRLIYDRIESSKSSRHFICCSRQLGKSTMLVIKAFEVCLRKPGARVLFLAQHGKDAKRIVQDIAGKAVLGDCPAEFMPEFKTQDSEYHFKNGSIIRFRGVNGDQAHTLRGAACDLIILDECGFMDNLDEVVVGVVDPMTATTNGTVIMATTPSTTPGHDAKKLYDQAMAGGYGYEFSILYAEQIPASQRLRLLMGCGETEEHARECLAGRAEPKTTKARREYWCKWVTEAGSAIIPEFDAEAKAKIVVPQRRRPEFYDAYVCMDPGHTDNTGILFAYFDARTQQIVIEDEWLQRHAGTGTIAEAIRAKETALWPGKTPYMRISDIENRLMQDLTVDHGLPFVPTLKKDSKGAVWKMRQMVKSGVLVVDPRCTNLIRQMETATWNRKGSDFADEVLEIDDEKVITHFDLVAALKYLCRMVNFQSNPFPAWHREYGATAAHQPRPLSGLNLFGNSPMGKRLSAHEAAHRGPRSPGRKHRG